MKGVRHYLTIAEAAQMLNLTDARVRQLVRAGQLVPDIRLGVSSGFLAETLRQFAEIPRPTGVKRSNGKGRSRLARKGDPHDI